MSELGIGLVVILWLALGGYAFRIWGHDTKSKELGWMFVACILLAPVAAGAAFADRLESKTNATPKQPETQAKPTT